MESTGSAAVYAQEAPQVELAGVEVLATRSRARPKPAVVPQPVEVPLASIAGAGGEPPIVGTVPPFPPIPADPPRLIRRHSQIMDVFQALSRILAVRVLLFLTLCGAFVLALQAMERQSNASLAVLVAYSLLTIAPLVFLEVRGKPILRGA